MTESHPHCEDCGRELWPLMDQEHVDGRLLCGHCAVKRKKRKR